MSKWPPHFCASCGVERKPFPRYPWHFCNDCRKQTCDQHGRRIHFGNTSLSGGLDYWFEGETERKTISRAICYINRRPVLITEARFGGVVAQPIPDSVMIHMIHDPKHRVTDLRKGPE